LTEERQHSISTEVVSALSCDLGDGWQARPIEPKDLPHLMAWRNAQRKVLRQQETLTADHQARWFETHVAPTYVSPRPRQLLVVLATDGAPMSYGGLTNIDWYARRAELSFLAQTERARNETLYVEDFLRFLNFIIDFSFSSAELNRLFTETWDFRTAHIATLERAGLYPEGRLRQHNAEQASGPFTDALMHGILANDWKAQSDP